MNQFRKARLLAGITQGELAKRVGVSVVSVNKWENGHVFPDVRRLKTVADALNTTVDVLISEKEVS